MNDYNNNAVFTKKQIEASSKYYSNSKSEDEKWLRTAFQSNYGENAVPTEYQIEYFKERVAILVYQAFFEEDMARISVYDELF